MYTHYHEVENPVHSIHIFPISSLHLSKEVIFLCSPLIQNLGSPLMYTFSIYYLHQGCYVSMCVCLTEYNPELMNTFLFFDIWLEPDQSKDMEHTLEKKKIPNFQ